MNSVRREATIQQQIERRRFKMSWEDVLKVQLRQPSSMQGANTQAINRFYDAQMKGDLQRFVDELQRAGKVPNFSIMISTKQPSSGFVKGRLGGQTYVIGSQAYASMGQPNPDRIYEILIPKIAQGGFEAKRGLRGGIKVTVPKAQQKDIQQRNPGRMSRATKTILSRLPGQ